MGSKTTGRPPVERYSRRRLRGFAMPGHGRPGMSRTRPWRTFGAYRPEGRDLELSPEHFWNLHGSSLFALARALLGDHDAAVRAVCLAMVDLYTWDVPGVGTSPETLRRAAGLVFDRCEGGLARQGAGSAAGGHPAVVRLGELAAAQRAAVALCVYGGHTYQLAAVRLELPAEVVADLLRSGLRELATT